MQSNNHLEFLSRSTHSMRGAMVAMVAAPFLALMVHEPVSAEVAGDPYPLADCPVSAEALGSMGEPIAVEHDVGEVRFCCAACADHFEDHESEYWEAIHEAIRANQKPVYPLSTCVINGEPLDAEDGRDIVYRNRLVRLSSAECEDVFLENPAEALSQLNEAVVEENLADYPAEQCVVSGEELGSHGEPVNYVIANRLVRVCCPPCIDEVEAQPANYYLEPAEAAESPSEHDHGDASHRCEPDNPGVLASTASSSNHAEAHSTPLDGSRNQHTPINHQHGESHSSHGGGHHGYGDGHHGYGGDHHGRGGDHYGRGGSHHGRGGDHHGRGDSHHGRGRGHHGRGGGHHGRGGGHGGHGGGSGCC